MGPKEKKTPKAPPGKPNKMQREASILAEDDIDSLINDRRIEPEDNPKFRLDALNTPADAEVTPRDLIEAFYAKHDEKKLETDVIEKFVIWVEQHSLKGLDDKLKAKYGEGLDSIETLALRRRNLEDRLTAFYCEHDMAK